MQHSDYIIFGIIFVMLLFQFIIKKEKILLLTIFILYFVAIGFMIINYFESKSIIEEILTIANGNPYAIMDQESFMIRVNILFMILSIISMALIAKNRLKKIKSAR